MNFDKRTLLIGGGVLIFFIIVFVVIFGSGVGGDRTVTPTRVQLSIWGIVDTPNEFGPFIEAYRNAFGSEVKYQQFSQVDYERRLLEALAAGKGPDIYAIKNTWIPRYQDKITPAPINLLNLRQLEEEYVEVVSSDIIIGDRIYSLPVSVDTLALFYNKDMFNAAGVAAPPKTWQEFAILSQRLTQKSGIFGTIERSGAALGRGDNVANFKDIISLMMMQAGEKMVDEAKRVSFDRVGGPSALDFYVSFSKQGNVNQSWDASMPNSLEAFATGKVAMVLGYNSDLDFIRARSPQLNFGVAKAPQQQGSAANVTHASYWTWVVSNQSQNADQSWQLLNLLRENDEVLFEYLLNSEMAPAQRRFIPQFQAAPIVGIYSEQNLTAKSWFQRDEEAVSRIFANMVNSLLEGRLDARRALQEAAFQVSRIVQ
ncbi:extracellular solute-binding protein [Candidatus Parcubacteria bacterium]|nr:MAG: extracellular solute-binding protein [Candidatus Parcubacteria bacterium]